MPSTPLDLSGYAFTAEDLKGLPAGPGVYRFLDRLGRVLYVGKAKNLRVRVGSYFTPSARGTAKGRAILEQVNRLQIDPVASELEANLLEAAMIAEHRPALNRQFDVHERPAPYGPRLNLVVVLRDAAGAAPAASTCTFHVLRGGRYVGRVGGVGPGASPSAAAWARTRALISRLYFPESPQAGRKSPPPASAGAKGDDDGVDIDWQLVASFLRKYHDAINVLDVDECATPEEAEARLRVLAASTIASPGRTLAR